MISMSASGASVVDPALGPPAKSREMNNALSEESAYSVTPFAARRTPSASVPKTSQSMSGAAIIIQLGVLAGRYQGSPLQSYYLNYER